MRFLPLVLLPALASSLAFTAEAQTLRGITVDASAAPVPGVVVLLLDSASRVAARGLTNGQGEFRLTAAGPGTYHLRTLRIGFQPTESVARLTAGAEVSMRVALTGIPVALDTVRTTSRNVCRTFSDSGATTYTVWQQVHAALTATDIAANARSIVATTIAYERTLNSEPGSGRETVTNQRTHLSTDVVTRPWRELPADSLRRTGYVVPQRDNSVVYYAPGLGVLLSDAFVEDHCFRVTTDVKSPALVGIAFEPSRDRKKVAEIRGILWVDRSSAELRRLEFGYTNVEPEEQQKAGGEVEFKRVRDGTWLISRWNIRMPVLEQVTRGRIGGFKTERRVAALEVTGGELALARRGSDTLWTGPPLVVHGVLRDSISGAGIDNARIALVGTQVEATTDNRGRFTLHGPLPGEYIAEVHTRSLDSVNTTHRVPVMLIDSTTSVDLGAPSGAQFAAALCGRAPARGSGTGVIVGRARLTDSVLSTRAPTGLRVVAEWSPDANDPSRLRRTEVHGAADGSFRICDVPLNLPVALRAAADSAATADPRLIRLSSAVRLARTDLALLATSDLAKRGATFIGIVVADSSRLPIAAAEVALPELSKSAFTDSTGAFRIAGIASGEHRVVVRRLGYGAADTKVTFTGFETVERRVVLGKAVTLEGVTVTATAQQNEREMPGFEDNKRVGLGRFMTRVDLEKFTGMKLGTALDQLSGVSTIHGLGNQLWVASRRHPPLACPANNRADCVRSHGYYIPDRGEQSEGMPVACYAQVYIERVLMNGVSEPTQPFDLATIVPESVEAIEWYAGASQTPAKYARMGSNCGVLVIWSRKGI